VTMKRRRNADVSSPPGAKAYRRRTGVIWRPGQLGVPREPRTGWLWQSVWMNDGGEDAPMDEQSSRFFKHLTIGALVVVAVIVVVALLAR
jgi:hypothetical protein